MKNYLKQWLKQKFRSFLDIPSSEHKLQQLEATCHRLESKLHDLMDLLGSEYVAAFDRKATRTNHQQLGLNVTYKGVKYPETFHFLNPADFLYNANDLKDWNVDRLSWYLTEYDLSERYHFMVAAMGYVRTMGNLKDYYEFGCYGANTFRMALSEACKHELHDMQFYAFDSFEGLPVSHHGVTIGTWSPGCMAMSEGQFWQLINEHGLALDRIRTIKGFYDVSLSKALQEELLQLNRKAAIINIDCDLRVSAESVFQFIEPLMTEGTILYLDEYYIGDGGSPMKGVGGAFHDYEKTSKFSFLPFRNVGWWGKSFICV
jgi:hypothetical protein